MKFSEKSRAQEYYQKCNKLFSDAEISYYYNYEWLVIFETYTMLQRCKCDTDTFESVKNKIETEFDIYETISGYTINNVDYDVYIIDDETDEFRHWFEEFGFVAFDEKNNSVDFYWFYDQDNDLRIYDAASFDKFYNSYFSWLETD